MLTRLVRNDIAIRLREKASEGHERIGRVRDVPDSRAGTRRVEVDECTGQPVYEDGVVRGDVVMADHLVGGGVGIRELPDRSGWCNVASGRVVEAPQKPHRVDEDRVR